MAALPDYLNLIPAANSSQPNFVAVLAAVLQPFVDGQAAVAALPAGFDIDTAIGAQLDVVGLWVGLSRQIPAPIPNVYFSFDTPGLGFDQGVWFGPGSSLTGLTSLDDETYRLLLKIKIGANSWDGSLAGAQAVVGAIESNGTYIFVQDNFDMSMTIGVAGVVPSTLFIALVKQAFSWVRPATVNISSVSVTSQTGTPIFGFDVENDRIAGFDVGAWATNS